MLILYHHPYSQHARRVVALLEEAGIGYELRHVALEQGEHRTPEFLAINPNHQVPALVDGDVAIYESNAILRYLCVKHGLSEWYPNDPGARAVIEQWLDWNQCRLFPSVRDIVLNKAFLGDAGDAAAIRRGEENMTELLPILGAGLEGRVFLAGETPTIADLAVASNVTQLGFADVAPTPANVENWYKRVCEIAGFWKSLPPR